MLKSDEDEIRVRITTCVRTINRTVTNQRLLTARIQELEQQVRCLQDTIMHVSCQLGQKKVALIEADGEAYDE